MTAKEPQKPGSDPTRDAVRRELMALLLVYASLTVLPLLTGFACHG